MPQDVAVSYNGQGNLQIGGLQHDLVGAFMNSRSYAGTATWEIFCTQCGSLESKGVKDKLETTRAAFSLSSAVFKHQFVAIIFYRSRCVRGASAPVLKKIAYLHKARAPGDFTEIFQGEAPAAIGHALAGFDDALGKCDVRYVRRRGVGYTLVYSVTQFFNKVAKAVGKDRIRETGNIVDRLQRRGIGRGISRKKVSCVAGLGENGEMLVGSAETLKSVYPHLPFGDGS